ncbi:MAG: hypothetical protein HUU06_12620, partial [Planctomycetaceae bacterium]|nr:hypothetical protein [Planctomycetaceae bacterium]
ALGLPLPGVHHYFLGDDPAKWLRDVPRYGALRGEDLWPGVDLRWRGGEGGRISYDFLLEPGADPACIRLRFEGAASLGLDAAGDLLLATAGGTMRHGRPVAWQERDGERVPVAAAFRVLGRDAVGMEIGEHDPALPLVIDPEIVYSTYLGGNNLDNIEALEVDASGRPCVGGRSSSTVFPIMGAFQATKGSNDDAFLTVLSAGGDSLVYSTYFGGNSDDWILGLAIDGDGRITVGGWTRSTSFPTQSALQGANAGDLDGFVAKFAANGASLIFSTYLGGSANDEVKEVGVDAVGAVYAGGYTYSSNFPATPSSFQPTLGGDRDAFLCKYAADGATKAWCSFLGGTTEEVGYSLAVHGDGRAVLAGITSSSTTFPLEAPLQGTYGGGSDAFLTCFDADGTGLEWSTFLGGEGRDLALGVALAPGGALWAVGQTVSNSFPTYGAYQDSRSSSTDAFVARVSSSGAALEMSTYLGGSLGDTAFAVAVDSQGSAAVTGLTESLNFPTESPLQATRSAIIDVFVALFKGNSSIPPFSTYLGGNGDDRGLCVDIDEMGRIYVGGFTYNGTTYPVKDAYQAVPTDGWDGILTCILRLPPAPTGLAVKLVALRAVQLSWVD